MNSTQLFQSLNIELRKAKRSQSHYLFSADKNAALTHYIQNLGHPSAEAYREMVEHYLPKHLDLQDITWDVPFPPVKHPCFTFIDLFAGIGGFRQALQNLGGKCVFSSEWDFFAQKTYFHNYGEIPFGDKIQAEVIPNHTFLVAGFPCQAFSMAGKRQGFTDTHGNMFFEIVRILSAKKPKAFVLENVKGLMTHNKGKTLNLILQTLREDLGYFVPEPQLLNAVDFGVPQKRERVFFVGFSRDSGITNFSYPIPNFQFGNHSLNVFQLQRTK